MDSVSGLFGPLFPGKTDDHAMRSWAISQVKNPNYEDTDLFEVGLFDQLEGRIVSTGPRKIEMMKSVLIKMMVGRMKEFDDIMAKIKMPMPMQKKLEKTERSKKANENDTATE